MSTFEDFGFGMTISPSALAVFLGLAGTGQISLRLERDGLRVFREAGEEFVPFEKMEDLCLRRHLLSASLSVHLKGGALITAEWLSKTKATAFHQESQSRHSAYRDRCLADELEARAPDVVALGEQICLATSGSHYLRYSVCQSLLTEVQRLAHLLKAKPDPLATCVELRSSMDLIASFVSAPEDARQNCNRRFVQAELASFREFFDLIEAHPLTAAQRSAVVSGEDNTLVIAGAGSGKTSVIIAKAGYLVKRGICKAEQILLLAYSHDATQEIEARLKGRVSANLKAATFHSLGLEIIAQVQNDKPSVAAEASDPLKMRQLLQTIVAELQKRPEFAALCRKYFGSHLVPYRNIFDFRSLGEYWSYLQAHEIRSLQGDTVKSLEELEIANFLFLNGIKYEYERPYRVRTATTAKRQYQPDFTILEPEIYVEHFCLNKQQRPPSFIDAKEYLDGVKWKQELHAQEKTKLIQTFSNQKADGILLTELERQLREAGVTFNPIPAADMFKKLAELGTLDRFTGLVATVLNHFKSNLHTMETIGTRASRCPDKARVEAFLKIFEAIFAEYQDRLRFSGQVDFNDMIAKATQYVEAGRYQSQFEYILVDEFQDIAVGRARLLKALARQNKKARLFCVGDDWQAIYRFAGSDIAIMRNFAQEFGHYDPHTLDRTFRYNNQINDLSSKFIQKNGKQIPKSLTPNSVADTTSVWMHRIENSIEGVLREILTQVVERTKAKPASVLMLGRYNHLAPSCLNLLAHEFPTLSLKFLTVHRSKGLEADYVIILGLAAGRFGFPTEIADDPILDMVLSEPEEFPHAEERRLFYVGLTRAKTAVHLVVDASRPSIFVNELLSGGYKLGINGMTGTIQHFCPLCKTGMVIPRNTATGREYYACTHVPFCEYSPPRCPKCEKGFVLHAENGVAPTCTNTECGRVAQLCPSCSVGIQIQRNGPYGPFLGCSRYPNCTYKARLSGTASPAVGERRHHPHPHHH